MILEPSPFAELPRREYEQRLQKARDLMVSSGLGGMLLFHDKNVYYYSAYRRTVHTAKVEGLLLPVEGLPVLFMPQLTSRYAQKAVWIEDIRVYAGAGHLNYPRKITDLVVQTLKEKNLDSSTIGMELDGELYPGITFNELREIMTSLPAANFVDASPVIWQQRKIKSPYEQEILRTAARIGLRGFQTGLRALEDGMTEVKLSQIVWNSWMEQGIADTPMEGQLLVRTGSRIEGGEGRYPCSHARPSGHPIRRGETVLLDAGPCYRGYFADLMRQACIGPPSDVLRRLFDTALAGYQKGLDLLKPGVRIAELAQKSVEAMMKFNPEVTYPLSFVGHSIGLTIHEPPWFSVNEKSLLEPGMVINFEIGAYDLPQWRTLGGFLEDMFLITENGYENLTEEGTMTLHIVD